MPPSMRPKVTNAQSVGASSLDPRLWSVVTMVDAARIVSTP